MAEPICIVMPLYDGVTHLDFTGPHQFFARAPGVAITVASVGAKPVRGDGLVFAGLADLKTVERCDVLCVPGGAGCTAAMADRVFMDAVCRLAMDAHYITSVCTGSLILGAAGLLKGKRAACHWAWRDMLKEFGAVPDGARVVRDGNLITGGGVTAGIDFALVLIAELFGQQAAQAVQLTLEYAPAPPFTSGRPETAPRAVLDAVNAKNTSAMETRRASVRKAAALAQT